MVVRLATEAMGTRFEIVLDGEDAHRLRPIGEAALTEIEEWHDRLSRFDAGSFVAHVNGRAGREPVPLDADLFELLTECAAIHRASDGAFDIAVGTGSFVLDDRRRTVRFAGAGTAIDLGGIGKGHALDRAAAILREHNIERALLHGGTSSVVAIGAPPGATTWRIALRFDQGAAVAHLRDAALSVSGAHDRDGETVAHVVDPRDAAPAPVTRLAAVIGPSAREADAWSTALLVLGRRPATIPEALATLITQRGAAGPHIDLYARVGAAFTIDEPRAAALETAR